MTTSKFILDGDVATELEAALRDISNHLYEQHDISDAYDYVTKIDQLTSRATSTKKINAHDGLPLKAVTRAYPGGNQDIVISEVNPTGSIARSDSNFAEEGPDPTVEHLAQPAKLGGYTDAFVTACVRDWSDNNFGDNGDQIEYRRELLREIRDASDKVEFENVDKYTYNSNHPSVYDDIYFTNILKLASPKTDDLVKLDKSDTIYDISIRHFIQEIEAVGPDIIIGLGDKFKETIETREEFSPIPLTGVEISENITALHNKNAVFRIPEVNNALFIPGVHSGFMSQPQSYTDIHHPPESFDHKEVRDKLQD